MLKSIPTITAFGAVIVLSGCATRLTVTDAYRLPEGEGRVLIATGYRVGMSWMDGLKQAVARVNVIVASGEFKTEFIGDGTWVDERFTSNDAGTVYDDYIGRRLLPGGQPFRVRFETKLGLFSNAHTHCNTDAIVLSRSKVPGMTVNFLAGTIAHELTHLTHESGKLEDGEPGCYEHGGNSPDGKEDSVPYRVGGIVRRLANEMYPAAN